MAQNTISLLMKMVKYPLILCETVLFKFSGMLSERLEREVDSLIEEDFEDDDDDNELDEVEQDHEKRVRKISGESPKNDFPVFYLSRLIQTVSYLFLQTVIVTEGSVKFKLSQLRIKTQENENEAVEEKPSSSQKDDD